MASTADQAPVKETTLAMLTRRTGPIMRYALAVALVALPFVAGCATTPNTMRALPLDEGTAVRYAASVDTVGLGLREALTASGAELFSVGSVDSAVMFVARQGDDFTRVLVRGGNGGATDVRVVSRPASGNEASRAERRTLEFIVAMDRVLGPTAMGPFAGARVRGNGADGEELSGTVERGSDGTLVLVIPQGTGPRRIPIAELVGPEVLRGSYPHANTGWWSGGLAGALIGAAAGGAEGVSLGAGVGGGAGLLLGSAFRTEVWSPLGPR
jgi:hypothetical protein